MSVSQQNLLLSSLSSRNQDYLVSRGTQVSLSLRTVLYSAEETPRYVYFMTSGIASIVTEMEDGGTAEVGIVGTEGAVGALHLLGPAREPSNSFVQLEGPALRVTFSDVRALYRSSEEVRDRLAEFIQVRAIATSQIAGCDRLHEAEERLARWLRMAQDRTGTDVLEFTQEFLAMMLGARRTTVTMIAGALQKAGLIEYQRGRVKILDRANLEAAACDCAQIIHRLHANLYKGQLE